MAKDRLEECATVASSTDKYDENRFRWLHDYAEKSFDWIAYNTRVSCIFILYSRTIKSDIALQQILYS